MINKAQIYYSSLNDGSFTPTGFKHLIVGIIAASVALPDITVHIKNVPNILDTQILVRLITEMNGTAVFNNNELVLNTKNLNGTEINEDLSQLIHGAIYLIPVLVCRFGQVTVGRMGGCSIGEKSSIGHRPIEHMLRVLEAFGCQTVEENGKHVLSAKQLYATIIDIMDFSDSTEILTGPLVSGATKTAILTALAIQSGVTVIKNPYLKADVIELLAFIKQVGYSVHHDDEHIKISKNKFQNKLIEFKLIPDLSQVMTYITCALYFNINIRIQNIDVLKLSQYLQEEFKLLKQIGVQLEYDESEIFVSNDQKIKAFELKVTSMGIYSDHQPLFALIATRAAGSSWIEEYVWINRFLFANELTKIGLNFLIKKNRLTIFPSLPNAAGELLATDLRAAAVLLIAALGNPHITTIVGLHHLNRGYDHLINDLKSLGAKIVHEQMS